MINFICIQRECVNNTGPAELANEWEGTERVSWTRRDLYDEFVDECMYIEIISTNAIYFYWNVLWETKKYIFSYKSLV